MSLHAWFSAIEGWPLAAMVRGDMAGSEWVFPIVETMHVFALAMVFGSIAMVDLRLLGLSSRHTAVTRLTAELLPFTWGAWATAALFGTLMFLSKAETYAGNPQFRMKFACMALAAVNMLVFQFGAFKSVSRWDSGDPPAAAKLAGALSLAFWTGVIFFGRWTGFTT